MHSISAEKNGYKKLLDDIKLMAMKVDLNLIIWLNFMGVLFFGTAGFIGDFWNGRNFHLKSNGDAW